MQSRPRLTRRSHRTAALRGPTPRPHSKQRAIRSRRFPKPAPQAPDPGKNAPDLDAVQAKQDLATQKLKLVQTNKAELDRLSSGLDACQLATVAFQNALDDLSAYSLEAVLRVKDGSLPAAKVPDTLKPEVIEKKKKELIADQAKRKERAGSIHQTEEVVAKRLDETNKAVLVAAAELSLAMKKLAQDQKSREMEKAMAGRAPADLLGELAQMVDEGHGLKGTFELNLRRFQACGVDVDRLKKELEDLKQPVVEAGQGVREEGLDQTARITEELVGYYEKRAKLIESLQQTYRALLKQGSDFDTDAAVSGEHLLKMQVIADVLKKTNAAVPPDVGSEKLAKAAKAMGDPTAVVMAAMEGAKSESRLLEKQLIEARSAGEAASAQLANLKRSQAVSVSAVRWESQVKAMDGPQALAAFSRHDEALKVKLAELGAARDDYSKAAATAVDAKAKREAMKDPFLRAAQEQDLTEKQKIIGELRKDAGLERAAGQAATSTAVPELPQVGTKKADADKATEPVAEKKKPEASPPTPQEKMTKDLAAFQQTVSSRVLVLDDRDVQKGVLATAVAAAEQKSTAYAKVLSEARQLGMHFYSTAVDLKKRIGRGELKGEVVPPGITQALQRDLIDRLDAENAEVLTAQSQWLADRESLAKSDPTSENGKALTKEILALVGQRLDLLEDLKELDADYDRPKEGRPPSVVKHMGQKASAWMAQGSSPWDLLLSIDSSGTAKNLTEILEADYNELVEIAEKEENLRKQDRVASQLAELIARESAAIAKMLPMLGDQLTRIEAKEEEEMILATARLDPTRADELLQNFKTKTGRLLGRPVPVADKDKDKAVEELAETLFERHAQGVAVTKWLALLDGRRGPNGLTAEAGLYQQEQGELKAKSAANSRRALALTGEALSRPAVDANPPLNAAEAGSTSLPVTGGQIGQTRDELRRLRIREVRVIALKIFGILIAACLLPSLLAWVFARKQKARADGETANMALSALMAFSKTATWVAALVAILTVLGFDVTAIIAGLGIGGLAIGLAAQPMIADIISAIIIFAERRFKIGDVITIGGGEPSRVVGLTWRSSQLNNADGVVVNIPNRNITSTNIQNLTRDGKTYDSINVTVSTTKAVSEIRTVIREAMDECKHLTTDRGESIKEFNHKGESKVIKYRFWWYLRDYEMRNKTRDEVFTRVSENLAAERLAGTEVTLS